MHCILISSPQAKSWKIVKSIEMISYIQCSREVHIQFLLLAHNSLQNGENTLNLLHRGTARCTLLQPWPFQRHPDEPDNSVPPLLCQFYGEAFEDRGYSLLYKKTLLVNGQWRELSHNEEVHPYFPYRKEREIEPILPRLAGDEIVPFTEWTLTNFTKTGLYLICFSLTFGGDTYNRLVEARTPFTVDGPQRLLSRIKYCDIPALPYGDQKEWLNSLQPFESAATALVSASYDIIILDSPPADKVEVKEDSCSNGIYLAPVQPRTGARRFVTADQSFTLPLCYSEVAVARAL